MMRKTANDEDVIVINGIQMNPEIVEFYLCISKNGFKFKQQLKIHLWTKLLHHFRSNMDCYRQIHKQENKKLSQLAILNWSTKEMTSIHIK